MPSATLLSPFSDYFHTKICAYYACKSKPFEYRNCCFCVELDVYTDLCDVCGSGQLLAPADAGGGRSGALLLAKHRYCGPPSPDVADFRSRLATSA